MSTLHLHLSDESDMAERFVSAWTRAERGEAVNERHLTFLSLDTLLAALSPERLALLRRIHRGGGDTTEGLALGSDRGRSAIEADLAALEASGLILREGDRLRVPWDRLAADLAL